MTHFEVLIRYVIHLCTGALMFAAMLGFGVLVRLMVTWVAPYADSPWFTELMDVAESAILCIDIAFLLWWSVISTFKAAKELLK